MDLMAAGPEVQSPVAMAFDEEGRLFVVERSEQDPEAGRIRQTTRSLRFPRSGRVELSPHRSGTPPGKR